MSKETNIREYNARRCKNMPIASDDHVPVKIYYGPGVAEALRTFTTPISLADFDLKKAIGEVLDAHSIWCSFLTNYPISKSNVLKTVHKCSNPRYAVITRACVEQYLITITDYELHHLIDDELICVCTIWSRDK